MRLRTKMKRVGELVVHSRHSAQAQKSCLYVNRRKSCLGERSSKRAEVTCCAWCEEVLHFGSTDGLTSHRTRINKPSQASLSLAESCCLLDGAGLFGGAPFSSSSSPLSLSILFPQLTHAQRIPNTRLSFFLLLLSNIKFPNMCVCVCVVTIFEMEMIFRPPHSLKPKMKQDFFFLLAFILFS